MSGDYKFDTLSLHAGHVPDERHGSRAVPIHQTTSYVFKDTEHAAALYNMEQGGHLYSRISNPTVAVLEQRIAALEGGVAATATASGATAGPPSMRARASMAVTSRPARRGAVLEGPATANPVGESGSRRTRAGPHVPSHR